MNLTITTTGQSADTLIKKLEKEGICVSRWAKEIIARSKFKPTKRTYTMVSIEGNEFPDKERTTKNIYAKAKERGYELPPLEVALYLRFLEQKEFRADYVAMMHEPICDSFGYPHVLALHRFVGGGYLDAWFASPGFGWGREFLFLFLAPQVSPRKLSSGTSALLPLDLESRVKSLESDMLKIRKFLVLD